MFAFLLFYKGRRKTGKKKWYNKTNTTKLKLTTHKGRKKV